MYTHEVTESRVFLSEGSWVRMGREGWNSQEGRVRGLVLLLACRQLSGGCREASAE